jgi:hypothetical protein
MMRPSRLLQKCRPWRTSRCSALCAQRYFSSLYSYTQLANRTVPIMRLFVPLIVLSCATYKVLGKASDASTEAAAVTVTAVRTPGHVDQVFIDEAGLSAQDPMQIGSMPPTESPRQRQEKAHLMKRMDRNSGKWTSAHPRYRLLETLYSFSRYRERNLAELKRWRDMYSNVKSKQEQVSNRTRLNTPD